MEFIEKGNPMMNFAAFTLNKTVEGGYFLSIQVFCLHRELSQGGKPYFRVAYLHMAFILFSSGQTVHQHLKL